MKKELFKDRLRLAAELRGLRQADLCAMTGIKKSRMSQYFSGAFEPKQDGIYLLAKVLNVSEAWLMGFDAPMERNDTNNKNSEFNDDELTKKVIELLNKLNPYNREIALAQIETLLKFQENK